MGGQVRMEVLKSYILQFKFKVKSSDGSSVYCQLSVSVTCLHDKLLLQSDDSSRTGQKMNDVLKSAQDARNLNKSNGVDAKREAVAQPRRKLSLNQQVEIPAESLSGTLANSQCSLLFAQS